MINFKAIRDAIFSGMNKSLEPQAIEANQTSYKPDYPFYTVLFAVPLQEFAPHTGVYKYGEGSNYHRKGQEKMTLSVSSFSDDSADALQNAYYAAEWFAWQGYNYLKENGIIVVRLEQIENRDVLKEDEYERRYGFDVHLRIVSDSMKESPWIEKVKYKE